MQDKAPQYLKEYCISFSDTDSRQRLRSASGHLLTVPRHRRTSGRRAFAVAGPTASNSPPDDLRIPSCCDIYFGRFLKSILFSFYSLAHSALEVFLNIDALYTMCPKNVPLFIFLNKSVKISRF